MWITVIIPRNFFSFLQSKNYHKAFLKGFQKKRIVRHFKKFAPDQTEARRAEKIFLGYRPPSLPPPPPLSEGLDPPLRYRDFF